MDVDGTWVFDEVVIDSAITQDEVWVLDALPIDSPVSNQGWIVDERQIYSHVSQPMANHPLRLWMLNQLERLQQNSAFLQQIQEQLIRPELESMTKIVEFNDSVKDEICTICQMDYEDCERIAELRCGHEFHFECLKRWLLLKNVCPLCKQVAIKSL